MVHKYTIAFVGDKERNVLIGLLGACTAVGIPDINALSVLDKRCKAFACSVYQFTNR